MRQALHRSTLAPVTSLAGPPADVGGRGVGSVETLVLGSDGPEEPRRARRWPSAVLAGVLVLLALLWTVDRWQQGREFDAVMSRAAAAQTRVAEAEAHVDSMIAYVAPGRYAPDTSGAIKADLEQLVATAALEAAATLRQEAAGISAVPVSSRYGAIAAARAVYVRQLLAQADAYDALRRRDPVLPSALHEPDTRALGPVRAAFEAAATSAAGRSRADAVFAR
jgi:hypothetical protein